MVQLWREDQRVTGNSMKVKNRFHAIIPRVREKMSNDVLTQKLWKFEVSEYILFLMIFIYSVVFSYFSIMRHYSIRTFAWDIGIVTQSISSASKGLLFKNNVELYFSPTGSYFGLHFSPIYFLVVPF